MIQARLKAHSIAAFATLISGLMRPFRCSIWSHSPYALFTGASILGPLVGAYGGVSATISAFCIKTVSHAVLAGSLTPFSLFSAYHIPTFCASLYWAFVGLPVTAPSWWKRLALAAVPACCILLFISHPVGSHAIPYSLFWLLPLLSALIPHQNRFLHAIASVCVAHAVGSVQWLLTHTLSAAEWYHLIPVACVERFFMAACMVVCMHALDKLASYRATRSNRSAAQQLPTHTPLHG
jgi:hypothetical protein